MERQSDGSFKTLRSESLEVINKNFLNGTLSFDRAKAAAQDLLHQMRSVSVVVHNQANQELLKKYWDEEYSSRRIVNRESAWHRLANAIDAIGHYNLLSASQAELQKEVDDKFQGNRQRVIVSALNQLLKYFKRSIRLRMNREIIEEVRFVSREDFEKLVNSFSEKDAMFALLCKVAFGTGLRVGEIFALRPQDLRNDCIQVNSQIDYNRIRRHTKTRKNRSAPIIPGFEDSVKEWIAIPMEEKLKFRKLSFAKKISRHSMRILKKPLRFHDLRHSFAVLLVSRGVSLTLVSQALGNTIKVAERFYSGYSLAPESIQHILSILRQ